MRDHSNETFATKQDLKESTALMKQDLKDLGVELRQEMKLMRVDMDQLGDKLTIRLGGVMVVGMGLLAAFLKLS